ncbi:MAG: maltooligosyltrehalose synthase [Planctomycetaceae bacterium]|nr:maltooligosyltrehalose synthase [Planctomycetaceae bacterium]
MEFEVDTAPVLAPHELGLALMQEPASVQAGTMLSAADQLQTESDLVEQSSTMIEAVLNGVYRTLKNQRWPQATYRVQFNSDFTFRQAADLVPYWARLGISDCYASPYLKAVSGSRHCYDIVDHATLNPELGTPDDFSEWIAALRTHRMGHILDFVPNHMGVASNDNAWWQDVLENGPSSRFAPFFDIYWQPLKADLKNKVLLPVLGGQFGKVLEDQQLQLVIEQGAFFVIYYSRRFPITPRSFALILRHRADVLATRLNADDPAYLEFQSILTSIAHLPSQNEKNQERLEERQREKEVIKRRLNRLCEECSTIQTFIQENITEYNGQRGDPRSFDLLDELLQQQAYHLSFWRVAADEINYRRFFDVNELAAICMERSEVFQAAHGLVFQLLREGKLDGLRIDHADGLYDPTAYLWQLQESRFLQLCQIEFDRQLATNTSGEQSVDAAGPARLSPPSGESRSLPEEIPQVARPVNWADVESQFRERFHSLRVSDPRSAVLRPLFVVVEKIMERNERLPEDWPVQGSTGYEFLNDANGIFVDTANAKLLDSIYARFIGQALEFNELVYEAKRLIVKVSMSSEIHVLGHQLDSISERNRWTRDFTLHGLIQALREVVAAFPIYRTYSVNGHVLERDQEYVEQAIFLAKQRNRATSSEVFDFIRDVLLHRNTSRLTEQERIQRQEFVGRFQQFTGPMMAKSVEDTSFYRFHRLVSLNEVGGDPRYVGLSVQQFHEHNAERRSQRPFGMLATSTHDNKRAEDVRARINVISEIPQEWKQRVSRWSLWNKRRKVLIDHQLVPSRNDEYLLYQTLIGTWPVVSPRGAELAVYCTRIQNYMTKAAREAKQNSSWIEPNEAYEHALHTFVEFILSEDPKNSFRKDFEPFAQQIAQCGLWNSLGQLVVKLGSPGVPDFYQGTELWDFSLVDPDNRGQVDYARRRDVMEQLQSAISSDGVGPVLAQDLVENAVDGRIKLFVMSQTLQLRRECPDDLFTTGEYLPLATRGRNAHHVCAFARHSGKSASLVIVPRLIAGLTPRLGAAPVGIDIWADTALILPPELQDATWRNLFTNEQLQASDAGEILLADTCRVFPVAVLRSL